MELYWETIHRETGGYPGGDIQKNIYQSYAYVDALAKAKSIENLDQIYPGQVLDIPPMEELTKI